MDIKEFLNKKRKDEDLKSLLQTILGGNYSNEDLEKLLGKLDRIQNLDDLKVIVESCLKDKPKNNKELLNCIKRKIEKKLVEANSKKLEGEQKRLKIKNK